MSHCTLFCSESDARLKLEIQLRQLQAQFSEKQEQLSQVFLSACLLSSLLPSSKEEDYVFRSV